MKRKSLFLHFLCLLTITATCRAGTLTEEMRICMEAAAEYYQISPELLMAIARTESNFDALAVNHNRNGTRDIGLMQINSWWLPRLAQHGISEQDLWEPCVNIYAGAWILAQNIEHFGYVWEAVGAYHAGARDSKRARHARMKYAQKIRKVLQKNR